MIKKLLRNELFRYLLVGGMAILIDGLCYYFLVELTSMEPTWAKRWSFISGALWAFVMNKFFTFKSKEVKVSEPILFTVVYTLGFLFNSLSHDLVYSLSNSKSASFFVATGLSTLTNFCGQKFIVFRKNQSI